MNVMHAFLIIGRSQDLASYEASSLAKKLNLNLIEFPFKKIEDVRTLASFTKLKVTQPTAILLYSIESATEESVNAFLKNLEEPQEKLYYILTAGSLGKVLPTIVSRCQVIKIKQNNQFGNCQKSKRITNSEIVKNEEIMNFLDKTIGEKFAFIDKIKSREEAENFVSDIIYHLHSQIVTRRHKGLSFAQNAEIVNLTLNYLKANGNVQLQLTNMIINLV